MNAMRDASQQETLWNGAAGRAWVDAQETLDQMLRPFADLLTAAASGAVSATSGSAVLDVGCGTGGTTLALAERLGPKARCVGIDISGPMIDLARARALRGQASATFVRGDAQTYQFEPA